MKRALLAQGWKPPQPPPSYGGGFRSATVLSPFDGTPTRITLCGDQQILTATALRHRGTSTMVTVRLAQTAGYPCNPQPPVMPMSGQRAALPTLYNPSSIINDARGNSACVQDYGNGTGTMLRTTMSGAALLDHYGKQLQDSGWSRPKTINTTEGRTWTKPDSTGAPLELNLTVLSASRDSTCREINMQIRLPKKP